MDQQSPEVSRFDLPKPQAGPEQVPNLGSEAVGLPEHDEKTATINVETATSAPPAPASNSDKSPLTSSNPITTATVPTDQAVSAATTLTTTLPAIADDSDLIEKEWVLKAKQIVAETQSDPYTQNKEMTKVKADYLKKRYNKDIKLEEE